MTYSKFDDIWKFDKKKLIKKGKERKLKNENVYNVQNTGGTQNCYWRKKTIYLIPQDRTQQ